MVQSRFCAMGEYKPKVAIAFLCNKLIWHCVCVQLNGMMRMLNDDDDGVRKVVLRLLAIVEFESIY